MTFAMKQPHASVLLVLPQLARQLSAVPGELAARNRLLDLLARADSQTLASADAETIALEAMGLHTPLCGVARMSAARDGMDLNHRAVLRADPIHLQADPSRLILLDAATVNIDQTTLDAMRELINECFSARGIELRSSPESTHWYLCAEDLPQIIGASPASLRGQPLAPSFESLQQLGALKAVLTEVQMLLHQWPVNEQRIEQGLLPINSLWLWGGGELPATTKPAFDCVISDDELITTAAQFCNQPVQSLDTLADFPVPKSSLLVLDSNAACALELLQSLLDACATRGFVLYTAGERFTFAPWHRVRLWRRGKHLLERWRQQQSKQDTV